MLKESSFALLVMTAEDETSDGLKRARQNVVHEAGLFQGRLGFKRALMLVEKDLDLFSNVDGIQYLEYSKGNIKETFGEVLATLKREFFQ
jgi:predicted nucleotide-binding protein